jgi:hypothetical protein
MLSLKVDSLQYWIRVKGIWLKKKMSARMFACVDRREVRRTDGGEGRRKIGKGTRQ